jgi:hypothetical protein
MEASSRLLGTRGLASAQVHRGCERRGTMPNDPDLCRDERWNEVTEVPFGLNSACSPSCRKRGTSLEAFMPPPETTERLRADIDSGRAGDKVPASDPAAAPLGTDDEAAGASPSPEVIEQTRRQETARPKEMPSRRGPGHAWILIAFIVFLATALISWALVSR